MHYLIDGHNLIAKMPGISLDDPNDEAKLVIRLKSWSAGSKRRRITVVFDSGLPGGQSRALSSGSVKVLFASTGSSADAILIGRIRKVQNPAEYTLVTSDRAVIKAAQARNMPRISAESFAAQIQTSNKSAKAESDLAPVLSAEEVEEWLQLFKEAKND
jgi:predicted RNA-binding protein with PIN domain